MNKYLKLQWTWRYNKDSGLLLLFTYNYTTYFNSTSK